MLFYVRRRAGRALPARSDVTRVYQALAYTLLALSGLLGPQTPGDTERAVEDLWKASDRLRAVCWHLEIERR